MPQEFSEAIDSALKSTEQAMWFKHVQCVVQAAYLRRQPIQIYPPSSEWPALLLAFALEAARKERFAVLSIAEGMLPEKTFVKLQKAVEDERGKTSTMDSELFIAK